MSTTSETELRAEIAWLEARNREVNLQRIEAETVARSQAARLSELERENARMRAALEEIAKQVPAKDMDEDYYEAADFEDGYDRCVFQARAALAGSGGK